MKFELLLLRAGLKRIYPKCGASMTDPIHESMDMSDRETRGALLERLRREEGDDPRLIAERIREFPNSGNAIDARKLAKALLAR